MTPEFKYLAELARAFVGGFGDPVPRPQDLDWKKFTRLTIDHKVAGALLPLVSRDGLEPELLERMDSVYSSFAQCTILRLLHLEMILPALEKAGCRPIVLKGSVLATNYYPQPEQRYLNDLDILVDPDRVDRTCQVLGNLGLDFLDTIADPLYYEKYHFHWILGNKLGILVEVHWDLNMVKSSYRFNLAGLRNRATTLPLNNSTMLAPSPADLLLHTVSQNIEGGFVEFRHVLDAALVLPQIKDHGLLVELAKSQNLGIGLWALLGQVSRWTNVAVPLQLTENLTSRGFTARVLGRTIDQALSLKQEIPNQYDLSKLFNCLCAPTKILRLREFWKFFFPGESYWLEKGFSPQAKPKPQARFKLSLGRLLTFFQLLKFVYSGKAGPKGEPAGK